MISDEYFYNLSKDLLDNTEAFTLLLIERVKQIALTLSRGNDVNLSAEEKAILRAWSEWNESSRLWVDNNLPKAYKKGITSAQVSGSLSAGSFVGVPLFQGSFAERISDKAREILKDYPQHLTMYGVFQEQAYQGVASTRLPVVRNTMDVVRDLSILSSNSAYVNADSLTRRQLSQEIMRPFLDKGVTGVVYKDGRTVQLDSYAEMVARTQTGNAARQANFNRLQEYGVDLVLISQHYPTSDLCAPYQGRVFSISGSSEKYPALSTAISGGLYHANCKHSQSGYRDGQRIPEAREKVDSAENKRRYKLTQVQRYNERQIKSWKRRQQGALTKDARDKASAKVKQWQARQRNLLGEEPWLRRRYDREQI